MDIILSKGSIYKSIATINGLIHGWGSKKECFPKIGFERAILDFRIV
jgi:hypothetical protein